MTEIERSVIIRICDKYRQPTYKFRNSMQLKSISLILVSVLAFYQARAEIPVVPLSELNQQKGHEKAIELISRILSKEHYKKTNLDDSLSSIILTNYLKILDQNKSYFIQKDIDEFMQYRHKIDDAIHELDLSLAFKIFKRYRQRVDERSAYAVNLLNEEFDFNKNETYRFDRREASWPWNEQQINTIWRKRVKNDVLNLRLAEKKEEEINELLTARYKRLRTSIHQLNSNDIFQSFINAYTTAIEPHTAYFSPRTSENFDISMRLSLEGIGAVLRGENDYTQVVKIIPGGPAELSGQLKAEDRIVGVGQGTDGNIIDVIGWRLDDVVDKIRGPKNTQLRLGVLKKDNGYEEPAKLITLTRDKIKLEEQAASSSIIALPEKNTKIGVINIPTFYIDFVAQSKREKNYKSTTRDVRKLIDELEKQGMNGLIVDLRNNGGGSLFEALELTGLFIDQGPIVQTKDSAGRVEINKDPEPGISYNGPLAVLVNRNSASASEIFAGAIQDYQRGIIIGEPTFGKGTVQSMINLNHLTKNFDSDLGRLKTTVAQFYRISGGSNQYKGVVPDIIFPTAEDSSKHGERAYDNALPWDEVKPAKYRTAGAPTHTFSIAKAKHISRIENDELFKLFLEDIELTRTNSERENISLLEAQRSREREDILRKRKDIQNKMRKLQGLKPLSDDEDADADETEQIDILLNETANILHDLIVPGSNLPDELKTVNEDNPIDNLGRL